MPDEELELGAEAANGEGKKKAGMKMIIIIAAGVLVLGGGGFAAWKLFFSAPAAPPAAQAPAEGAKKETAKEGAEKPGAVLNLEPFIVNLADPGGKRYLKLTLAIDTKNEQVKKDLEMRMPQIRDSILLLLTSKTYGDISQMAGKIKLRNEVLKIVNNSLGGATAVHNIYFTEFVIQ